MPTTTLILFPATHPTHFERVRALFREYQQAVNAPICFTTFAQEVAGLPGDYAGPRGGLWLAEVDGEGVGCVALRPLAGDANAAELKRLYVRPVFRRRGLGRILVRKAIEFARATGYRRVQLGTLDTMQSARRLYSAMGFQNIAHPEGIVCDQPVQMELKL